MGKRAEEAVKKHHSGYNCAQAVACTFSDVIGMDERRLPHVGRLWFWNGQNETCGAVCGMLMIASALSSDANLEAPSTKQKTYKLMRENCRTPSGSFASSAERVVGHGKGRPKLKLFRLCGGCRGSAGKKNSRIKISPNPAGLQDTKNNRPPPDGKIYKMLFFVLRCPSQ